MVKITSSRRKLGLLAVFALVGAMSMISQRRAGFNTLPIQQVDRTATRELLLPSSNLAGAWQLTLQLLTSKPELVDAPQNVAKELEKLVSSAVSSHGLQLIGVTAIDPSRHSARTLQKAEQRRTSSHLLIGSAVDDADGEEFDFEDNIAADTTTTSLFMRAIIMSTHPDTVSVPTLVQLARKEVTVWSQQLSSVGLPITGIEVVSLAPHAPTSIEAKLQAQLLVLQEQLGTGSDEEGY